ncbi:major facilitator superfamily domain-containing protein [Lipomyces starkeyi]
MNIPSSAQPQVVVQISAQSEPIRTEIKNLETTVPVPTASEAPYTVFSISRKRAICAAATCSAMFSPLATNIYFPSITAIASDLHVSVEMINITVTTYMILQGIAPTFWGSFADVLGRRPVYLATITVFMLANLGLALQDSYASLLVLRMCQSAGSSATVAIGAGTIADVALPAERGSYICNSPRGRLFGSRTGRCIINNFHSESMNWLCGGILRLLQEQTALAAALAPEPYSWCDVAEFRGKNSQLAMGNWQMKVKFDWVVVW